MQIWLSRYGPWIIFPTSSSTELWLSKAVPYNFYTSKSIQITFNWNEGSYSHLTAIVLGSHVNSGNNFNTSEALFMFGMFSLQLFERPQKPMLQISIWIVLYLLLQVFCLLDFWKLDCYTHKYYNFASFALKNLKFLIILRKYTSDITSMQIKIWKKPPNTLIFHHLPFFFFSGILLKLLLWLTTELNFTSWL